MPLRNPPPIDVDLPLAGECVPRRELWNSAAGVTTVSGTMLVNYFTATVTETVTNVITISGTAAAATPTLCRIGIYAADAAGALTSLLASTASDTALYGSANTEYTKALQASWAKTAGSRYAVGVLVVSGQTMPSFAGLLILSATAAGAGNAAAVSPRLAGKVASQSDLPASVVSGGITNTGGRVLARFS